MMHFQPSPGSPQGHDESDLFFLFRKDMLMVKFAEECHSIPLFPELPCMNLSPAMEHYIGTLKGRRCYAAEIEDPRPLQTGFLLLPLRILYSLLPEEQTGMAGRALQILNWHRDHRYCGRCGTATVQKNDERAMLCPSCGFLAYPRLSPVAIVAVVRGSRLLLARNRAFKNGMYSLVSGFVEPGESLEDAARREVMEEVGLEIGGIQYFGSQPWPFPGALMAGFTAHHISGEITVDGKEIDSAGWYSADAFPLIPPPGSISRKLIDWFSGQELPGVPVIPRQ